MSKNDKAKPKREHAPWIADAIKLFKSGRSQTDIANKHGVSRERVRQILLAHGGHRSRISPEDLRGKIMSLYDSGRCIDAIASSLKKNFHYVMRVLIREGVVVEHFRRRAKHNLIFQLGCTGKTIDVIAKELHVHNSLVFHVLSKNMEKNKFKELRDAGEVLRIQNSLNTRRANKK